MTTTSNRLDSRVLGSLPHLPRNEDGPVFAEPWQATVFALAVQLSAEGHFTWNEWAAALADELKAAAERGQPDDGTRYYQHWRAALERLVVAKGLSDPATSRVEKGGVGRCLSAYPAWKARGACGGVRARIKADAAPLAARAARRRCRRKFGEAERSIITSYGGPRR